METNPNTVFHSLHKLTSPTAHLAVFRGDQDSIHLLTDAYMSPFLHNSSDTYHRHLSRQLQHGLELYQGMHNRQWIHDTKGRRAFLRLTNHLENFTQPFVHGFQRERRRQDAERKLYGETGEEFRKREFVRKEEVGMSRCGWGVEDLDKIKKALIEEEFEEIERMTNSIKTFTTDVESVFDNEKEEDSDSEDEYDHLYDDCKPAASEASEEVTTFVTHSIIRDDSDIASAIKQSYEKKPETLEEYVRRTLVEATKDPLASPSSLLARWCYKPGSDDDSDSENDESDDDEEEDWKNVSPLTLSSTPSSYDDEDDDYTVIDTDKPFVSTAVQRKAKFLSDLLAVRIQVEIDIEEDWDFKVWTKEERMKEKNREGCEESWVLKQELTR